MLKHVFTLFAFIPLYLFSQVSAIAFEYDDAGNRIKRYVISLPETIESGKTSATTLNPDSILKHEFDINSTQIAVYPNPNGGKFNVNVISNENSNKINLFIHSLNGTKILSKKVYHNQVSIDISDKENGAYILTILVGKIKKTITIIKN